MARRRVPIGDDEVMALYAELTNGREVARRLGLSETTVYRLLDRRGIRRTGAPRVPRFVPQKKLAADQEEEVARRYATGERSSAIARDFGVSVWLVRETVRQQGGAIGPRGNRYREFSDQEISEMVRLWEGGESQGAIGKRFGVMQSVVSNVLARHGYYALAQRRARGDRHGMWRGGRIALDGYIAVQLASDDPLASMARRNGYVAEHRLVMARSLGRPLADHETIHHINGDRTDNRLENLQLRTGKHGTGVVMVCVDCGSHNVAAVPLTTEN